MKFSDASSGSSVFTRSAGAPFPEGFHHVNDMSSSLESEGGASFNMRSSKGRESQEGVPRLRGVADSEILDRVKTPDGKWVFKRVGNRGAGDFRVTVYDPEIGRQLTPAHAHFAIDLYAKLGSSRELTEELLEAIEDVYSGKPATEILDALNRSRFLNKSESLPGYSVPYILVTLQWILEQEEINWKRRTDPAAIPSVRKQLLKRGILQERDLHRGGGLAIALIRMVGKHNVHPVAALTIAGLEIRPRGRR